MSRVGLKFIKVPANVSVEISPSRFEANGPLGKLSVDLPYGIKVVDKEGSLAVSRTNDSIPQRSLHGTIRSLVSNAVNGVGEGYTKKLEMVGIGYRATLEGEQLILQVGFTHPVKITIPPDLKVNLEKNVIVVTGADKQRVGQFCAEIRSIRKPEPYKGKGIRYQGEKIRMKQGKAAKSGA